MPTNTRLSAAEIFGRASAAGEEELARPAHNLAFSALGAGLAMGLSGLGVALLLGVLGKEGAGQAVAFLGYSVGFVVVILGRQQLFTENTLFPVAATLHDATLVWRTAWLWTVVLAGNLVGTALFASVVAFTPAVSSKALAQLAQLGVVQAERSFATVFWTAVVAGWIVALVAWLVTAATDTSGRILAIVLLSYFVGLGEFAHSIAGSAEVLTALFHGEAAGAAVLLWHIAAVAGNAVGGVVIVAFFNYGQVSREEVMSHREQVRAERHVT